MANCAEKLHHKTERGARNHLRWSKHQPGGHGIRYLDVYFCPCGEGWCVGRAWRGRRERLAEAPKPVHPTKSLSPGQARRKAKREAEDAQRQAMFADWADTLRHVARMVDAEIRKMEQTRRL
jgi:hypothetical protein